MGLKLKTETAKFLVSAGITILVCGYFYAWQAFLFPDSPAHRLAYAVEALIAFVLGSIVVALLAFGYSVIWTLASKVVARFRRSRPGA